MSIYSWMKTGTRAALILGLLIGTLAMFGCGNKEATEEAPPSKATENNNKPEATSAPAAKFDGDAPKPGGKMKGGKGAGAAPAPTSNP